MALNLTPPDISELKPRITVFGVGGAGGNAVNNMITAGLQGVDFVVANTDAQALTMSKAQRIVQMGTQVTQGLGAGSQPDVHKEAAHQPEQPATPETFIPQAAERAPVRAPRMPKFEDLPMPAQAEIRQARGEGEEEHPQKSKLSLLQRLANVGLGRRDEETEPPIAARASGPAMAPLPPLPERKPQRSVAQQMANQDPVSEYAKRPAPQGLDVHGRPAPVAPAPQGDDHLDIPAFLRRQAN